MSEQVGIFLLHGDAQQNAILRPMARRLSATAGTRVAPIDVIPKPSADMPPAYGGTALGLWRDSPHDIWLDENFSEYPVIKTFVHEFGHAWDDDVFNPEIRFQLMGHVLPRATRWQSGIVGGKRLGAAAYASEAWAELAVVLFGGFRKAAYPGIFVREFPRSAHDAIKTLVFGDTAAPAPEPVPEPTPPTPPDPTIPLLARIAELEAANLELESWRAQVRGVVCP